jgi:hypothetical protein
MTMQRVIISNYDEYGDPTEGVGISSNSMTPIDVQSRLQTTIQTHNAVSVALSGSSVETSYHDADGFSDIAVTLMNDASTASSLDIYWSNDGVNTHGIDAGFLPNATNRYRAGFTQIKARYFKIGISNIDSAVAHTMSAWAYLKC